jgi:hypothetical protein
MANLVHGLTNPSKIIDQLRVYQSTQYQASKDVCKILQSTATPQKCLDVAL